MYNSPPVAQFPNVLPLVSGEQSRSSEHPQDSQQQHSIEETSTLSIGPCTAKGHMKNPPSTLLESFGYSEDSSSNTVALLKTVSAKMVLYSISCP